MGVYNDTYEWSIENFGSLDPGFIVRFSFLWHFPVVESQNLFVATFFYIVYGYNLYVCAKVITRGGGGGEGGGGGTRVSIAYQRLLKILFDNIRSQCSDINSINGSNNNNQRFVSFFFFNVNRSSRERRVNVTSKRLRKQRVCPRNSRDSFLRLIKSSPFSTFLTHRIIR